MNLGGRELQPRQFLSLCLEDKATTKEGNIDGLSDPKSQPIVSYKWGKVYSRKPKVGI